MDSRANRLAETIIWGRIKKMSESAAWQCMRMHAGSWDPAGSRGSCMVHVPKQDLDGKNEWCFIPSVEKPVAACTKRASFFLEIFVCTRFSGVPMGDSPDAGQ
eukprot:SAG11_NODE_19993_length_454_cov_5.718310_1_plen_102_part_01